MRSASSSRIRIVVRMLFRQTPQRQAPAPRVRGGPEDGLARRRAAPVEQTPEASAVPPTQFVHVVGDSLSDALANGLREHFLTESRKSLCSARGSLRPASSGTITTIGRRPCARCSPVPRSSISS